MPARRTIIVAIAILLVVAVALAWDRLQPPAASAWQSEPVARADIEASVNAIGTLQPVQSVDVGAQVSGQITRIHVQPGDAVTAGQLVAEIDASVLAATVAAGQAQIAGLQAQVDDAVAQQELAEQQHGRQQQLARDDATRLEDVQAAAATRKSATARVARYGAEIRQTAASLQADQARLGYTRIYAPIAGVVTGIDVKQGQTLNATYQTPTVLRIADLSRMTVWTDVSEADIQQVKAGMAASFTTLGGNRRRWRGTVRQVLPAPPVAVAAATGAPAAGTKAVQYTVLFDVDNPDRVLMPQMTAQVTVVAAAARGVLAVPVAALTSATPDVADAWNARVLAADGHTVHTRRLRVGVRDRMRAEVRDGLRAGELVITGEVAPQAGSRRFRW